MASAGAIAEAVQEFTNVFKGLCLNPKWSDIDVVCGNVIFPAHKIIVCAQSRHFASGCGYNSWADHFRVALVPDDHPLCVKLMLHFLYQGDYPHVEDPSDLGLKTLSTHSRDPSAPIEVTSVVVETQQLGRQNSASNKSPVDPPVRRKHLFVEGDEGNKSGKAHGIEGGTPPRPTPNLALHARMYAIGDKFGIPPLKGLAQAKFMDELGESWDTDDFLDAIEVVFTSEPFDDRGLRDVVMQQVWAHPLLVTKPKAKEIIKRLNLTLVFPRV